MVQSPSKKTLVLAFASLLLAGPAAAQFGQIFQDEPPRPPATVPGRTASPPPNFPTTPGAPPQTIPQGAPQVLTPQASPQTPSTTPGAGGIQSQPLPPPPGATAAPLSPNGNQPPPITGLPPGVRQPRGTPQPANTAPQPGDEVVVEPPPQKIVNSTAVFSGLDKITGRIITFDVAIDETVQLGALRVTPRACYTRPPTETPNTDGFVEVDEITLQGEVRRIFTGWMFAASPGLHAVEHPIYDVWLVDCKGAPAAVAGTQPPTPETTKPTPNSQPSRSSPARPGQPKR